LSLYSIALLIVGGFLLFPQHISLAPCSLAENVPALVNSHKNLSLFF
jgi:hypothetical protein